MKAFRKGSHFHFVATPCRITDRMVAWAQENDIKLRGHCVFWEDTQTVQPWARALDNTALKAAMDVRLNQVRNQVSLWVSLGFHYGYNWVSIHGASEIEARLFTISLPFLKPRSFRSTGPELSSRENGL
jgi:hypothetical protein